MAPLLIDSRDVLKLGVISILVMALIFFGGFLFGHQRATTFYQLSSDVQPLLLPEKRPEKLAEKQDIAGSKMPSIIEAGAEIDVDQPEAKIPEVKIQATNNSDNALAAKVLADTSENKEIPEPPKSAISANSDVSKVEQKIESNETAPHAEKQSAKVLNERDGSSDSAGASVVTAFTSEELSEIKYSIQVGMYGRLVNAENMMKMLQAQQFDAYVTDYTNKKNEIRYNVRFGYFADKKFAIAALDKFKSSQNGDGYLVRFSAENIVKVADAADIEQAIDVPVQSIGTDKTLTPVTIPSAAVQDKISQVDIVNHMSNPTTLSTIN